MRNWKLLSGVFAILLIMVLAACGGSSEGETSETNDEANGTENKVSNEESDGTYPLTVSPTLSSTESDEAGTVVYEDETFDKMPESIVVFDYGFLDTLDQLGVEGVKGLPKESTLPDLLNEYESDEYVNIGTLKAPLFEEIAEINPDVIFISSRQATFYDELKEIAPVVFVGTDPLDYWNTFEASVDVAATMFDKKAEAEEYLAQFDEALEELNEIAGSFESSLVTMYNEGNLSGFGEGSRFDYFYSLYGLNQVDADIEAAQHGSNVGYEAILEFNPDVLLVIDRTGAVGGDSNIEADLENDIIKRTDAYENDRIIYLDGVLWYLGGGGLQSELAKIEELTEALQ